MGELISPDEFRNFHKLNSLYFEKFGGAYANVDSKDTLLNKNQSRALMIIGRRGSMTNSELGKVLYMRKGSVTTLIDGLMEKNLIEKQLDPKDRRKTWITLTDDGQEHRQWKYDQLRIEVTQILNKLTEEDQVIFETSLESIIGVMEKL